jgi:hypothetical protein
MPAARQGAAMLYHFDKTIWKRKVALLYFASSSPYQITISQLGRMV